MKFYVIPLLFIAQISWAGNDITYFSCKFNEPTTTSKSIEVTVKFAIKGFDFVHDKGELISYPGVPEDVGAIFVSPMEYGKGRSQSPTMASNLNGQGGDLRLEGNNLRLFGDGAGVEFTDLVIWGPDEDRPVLEGYFHDYGDAYGDGETFKTFIKCKRSNKVL